MNFRYLTQFLAVVDCRGFTAAAEALHVAQPAISRSIRLLEEELGITLLDRQKGNVRLTAEGERFARHARAILAQTRAAQDEIAALKDIRSGHVTLGAPPMVASHLLPDLIGGFLRAHPGLSLTVAQDGSEAIRNAVTEGRLELGLIADWRSFEGVTTTRLGTYPVVACVAQDSPLAGKSAITWREFVQQPLILFPRGFYQRSQVDEAARRLGVIPTVAAEAEALPLIAKLVRDGHGAATMLADAAHSFDGVHALALPADATVPLGLCCRSGGALSHAATALRDHLTAAFTGN